MKNLYRVDRVFLEIDLKTKDEVLNFISQKAFELNIVSNEDELLKGFWKREEEASTAFEDGFAIPHAKLSSIKETSIICVRLKNFVEWNSLDGLPTNVVIALIIPENASVQHLEILSQTATKLMDDELRQKLKKVKKAEEFISLLEFDKKQEKINETTKKGGLNIVAVTSCVVGVAHTYMAEDKLLKELSKAGHNIRVETQGSKGIGTPLTKQEIDKADIVIIAADTKVDLNRFNNKKVYSTHVARAIKEPLKLLDDALNKGIIHEQSEFTNEAGIQKTKQGVLQHILAGISYMIPIIILGGICLASSLGLAKAIWGPESGTQGPNGEYPWNPLAILEMIGGASFTLMIPILAGFIANSIAGRAALAPAMLGGFIGNSTSNFMPLPGMEDIQTPMGFIGAILAGLLVGYYVKWVNGWKVPKSLQAAMPIFFIPLTAGIGISILFMYVIGGPIGYVMGEFSNFIEKAYTNPNFGVGISMGLGILIGAMASFDMGGPINKIAFVTCSALITQGIYYPMGTMSAAIPVAPLGMGISALVFKRFFTQEERGMGSAAIIMGTIGISEGAIPFAIRDPKRAIACNVLGGMVAGAIAGAFKIEDFAAHGGPIVAFLGAVPYGSQTAIYFIAVAAGVSVTVISYGLWLIASQGKIGSVKEVHIGKIDQIIIARNEKISEINNSILIKKTSLKEVRSDEEKNKILKEISELKLKKTSLKEEAHNEIIKAKEIFNSIKGNETSFIKTQKENIQAFEKNEKLIKNDLINKLKNSKLQEIQNLDNYQKKDYLEEYKNKLEEIKNNYNQKILNNKIELRQEFVDLYNSKF